MINFFLNSKLLLVLVIPFLLGCLSVLSFQPFNFVIINFFIFTTLFLIISNINKRSKNKYRKKPYLINLFCVGYFFGIGFFLTGTYWISNSLNFDENFKNLIPLTIILIPLALGLFYGLASSICGKYLKNDLPSVFLFSGTFSAVDYLRAKILTGFPWNIWAYSWSWFTEIIQILNPIGLFAFNLLTITLYVLPAILFMKKTKYKSLILIFPLIIFFGNYLYGNYLLNNHMESQKYLNENKFINIKIISPNFELKYNLSDEELYQRINKLIRYSNPEKSKKTLFIWPEGALSGKYFYEIDRYKDLIKKNFSQDHLIILGINTLDKKKDKFYNSFIVIDNNLNKKFQYNKIKLVPFGEFLPFQTYLEKIGLKKITEGFGSFSKGSTENTFVYENLEVIPLICYEIIFPELIQKINFNSTLLINISEDAWFGDSIGPHQHFSKSIFRAIESDSFVLRSANKGISAIINNKGQIIKSLKNNETGNIEYRLPIIEKKGGNKNDLIFFVLLFTYCFIFFIYKKND